MPTSFLRGYNEYSMPGSHLGKGAKCCPASLKSVRSRKEQQGGGLTILWCVTQQYCGHRQQKAPEPYGQARGCVKPGSAKERVKEKVCCPLNMWDGNQACGSRFLERPVACVGQGEAACSGTEQQPPPAGSLCMVQSHSSAGSLLSSVYFCIQVLGSSSS